MTAWTASSGLENVLCDAADRRPIAARTAAGRVMLLRVLMAVSPIGGGRRLLLRIAARALRVERFHRCGPAPGWNSRDRYELLPRSHSRCRRTRFDCG